MAGEITPDMEDECMSAEAAYMCLDVCVHRPRGVPREQPVRSRDMQSCASVVFRVGKVSRRALAWCCILVFFLNPGPSSFPDPPEGDRSAPCARDSHHKVVCTRPQAQIVGRLGLLQPPIGGRPLAVKSSSCPWPPTGSSRAAGIGLVMPWVVSGSSLCLCVV